MDRVNVMRTALAFTLLLLTGCETLFPSSRTYQPVIVEVFNKPQADKDMQKCHAVADNWNPGVSIPDVFQGTVKGATDNASDIPLNVLVVPAGAAGGAVQSVVTGVGLNGQQSITIIVRCLHGYAEHDHSFVIADPNE